jgi:hypothetical protein
MVRIIYLLPGYGILEMVKLLCCKIQHISIPPSGVYQVSLVATNAFGSDSTSISVIVSVVSAAFTVSGLQQIGQSLQFTAATQGATAYLWNFGDGFLSTLANPTHIYTAAGSYPVTLTVTSGPCVVTLTDTITILPVGIDYPEGITYLSLLPNPFKDDVTIEFVLSGEKVISLQVNDVLGQSGEGNGN